MTVEREKLLNLIQFMCSDDEGNWDQRAADELLANIKKEQKAAARHPYRVCWGYMCRSQRAFTTWPEALKFARTKRADNALTTYPEVVVYNDDHADGAEDTGASRYGLTEEEREEWEQ